MDRRAWTLLLSLAAIWGTSYMFIKIGLRDLTPEMIAFARIALAALILVPIAWSQGALKGLRPLAGWFLVIGSVQVAVPFVLIGLGEEHISSSLAGILIASRDNSVSPTTGGAQTLLYAVGAAVIGGTSLFGGRGKIYDAVTGGLVVAIIANGLPLVTQKSGTQFISVPSRRKATQTSIDFLCMSSSAAGL